jgi:hypothetical protein
MNLNKEYLCGKSDKVIKIKDCCTKGKCEFRQPLWIGLRHQVEQLREDTKELLQ